MDDVEKIAPAGGKPGGRDGEAKIIDLSTISDDKTVVKPDALAKWTTATKLLKALPGSYVIRLKPGTKKPAAKHWKIDKKPDGTPNEDPDRGTRDPAIIAEWLAADPAVNLGFCPGEHGAVIDPDVKPRKQKENETDGAYAEYLKTRKTGLQAWADLEDICGAVDTFTVNTPSGGRHLYFKVDEPVSNSHAFPPGIDVRGARGYVALAGSVLTEGLCKKDDTPGAYTIASDMPIAHAPDWVKERLKPKVDKDADNQTPLFELDLDMSIVRAREFLKLRKPAIEGDNGNDHTYATFCLLKDLCISDVKALELVMEEDGWNERCEPPWDLDEISKVCSNAYQYGNQQPGSKGGGLMNSVGAEEITKLTKSDATMPAATKNEKQMPDEWKSETFGTIIGRTVGPVAQLCQGLILKGRTNLLNGPGGSHKSRLGMMAGLSINVGAKFLGIPTERAQFVYLSAEDDRDEVTRRAQVISKRLNLPADTGALYVDRMGEDSRLAIVSPSGVELTPAHARLQRLLCSIGGHKFVLMDSAYDFSQFDQGAENLPTPVRAFVKGVLDRMCADTDSTILLLWHPSRAGIARGDFLSNSPAWENACRNVLTLAPERDKASKDTGRFELSRGKGNYAQRGKITDLVWADGVILPPDHMDDEQKRERFRAAVLKAATLCAEQGLPIKGQSDPPDIVYGMVEGACGSRPSKKEIKAELVRAAITDKSLLYIKGSNKALAGYYPPDRADQMAQALRRREDDRDRERILDEGYREGLVARRERKAAKKRAAADAAAERARTANVDPTQGLDQMS